MIFPSFPTDSIFKFLFIAGIFLYVFSFYRAEKGVESALSDLTKLDSLRTRQSALQLKVDEYSLRAKKLTEQSKSLVNKKNLNKSDEKTLLALQDKLERTQLTGFALSRDLTLLKDKGELARLKNDWYKEIDWKYRHIEWIALIIFIIGTIGWSVQQVKQNRLLSYQTKIIELEYFEKLNRGRTDE